MRSAASPPSPLQPAVDLADQSTAISDKPVIGLFCRNKGVFTVNGANLVPLSDAPQPSGSVNRSPVGVPRPSVGVNRSSIGGNRSPVGVIRRWLTPTNHPLVATGDPLAPTSHALASTNRLLTSTGHRLAPPNERLTTPNSQLKNSAGPAVQPYPLRILAVCGRARPPDAP